MKPISQMIRGDILTRMFPYKLKINYQASYIDWDAPLDQRYEQTYNYLLGDVPCSVQTAVANNGQLIENEYIILCPCIDMSKKEQVPKDATLIGYNIEVQMNGKTNKAKGTEILSVDNIPVYEVGGYTVGCKIRVKVSGNNWTW